LAVDIHARLKWAREKRGYASAREAADAIGVRYSTYAGHESGSRGIKREALRRYARFFRISPAWLEFGTSEEAPTEIADENKVPGDKSNSERVPQIQFVSSSFVEPMRLGGFIQAGIWVDPSIVLEETTTREGVSAIAGKWGGLPQFSYVAKDNSADQLRISAGDYVLCVPYERARGGQLHDKDIVVIERVRRGGAFERTIKQIILTESKCALVSRSSEPRYPSIEINAKTMTEKDGTIIRIVGLAIAVCIPLRTDTPGPLL
jgi:transcriptional regulator with XRE-family HTH domain